jgi:hypothetical protein
LFCFATGALELTPDKQIAWQYNAPEKTEAHACQPLPAGRVMLVECGASRIIEVDRRRWPQGCGTGCSSKHCLGTHGKRTARQSAPFNVRMSTLAQCHEHFKACCQIQLLDVPGNAAQGELLR